MKEKKSNGLLVIVAILCLLIGGVVGYFISNNYMKTNEANNKINTTNENTTTNESQCKYEKLKDASSLTDDEKYDIIENSIEYITPALESKIKSLNQYVYSVNFGVQDADADENTKNPSYVIIWKENGKWMHGDYAYSEEQLMQQNIPSCN